MSAAVRCHNRLAGARYSSVQVRKLMNHGFWIPLWQFDWRQAYPQYQAQYLTASIAAGLLLKLAWIRLCLRAQPRRLAIVDITMNVTAGLMDIAAIPLVAIAVVAGARTVLPGLIERSWTPPAIVLVIALGVGLVRVAAEKTLLRVLFDESVGVARLFFLYLLNIAAIFAGLIAIYIWSHPWVWQHR